MRNLLCLCLALCLPSLSACATEPNANVPPSSDSASEAWNLVWSDEFDTDGLPDPKSWSYDTHANAGGWYNDEEQYYAASRPENSRIENGALIITARKEQLTDMDDYGGQDYSSARLITAGKAAFQYGRVEARIWLPCGRGLWPAFWMLPEGDFKWPDDGEIDIMEYVGHDKNRVHAAIHTKAYNHIDGTSKGGKMKLKPACGAWYIHSLDWSKERLIVSVDGQPYFKFKRGSGKKDRWPFDAPFHVVLNIAVGGGWGGQKGIDDSVFPAQMQVDYVRIYQRPS